MLKYTPRGGLWVKCVGKLLATLSAVPLPEREVYKILGWLCPLGSWQGNIAAGDVRCIQECSFFDRYQNGEGKWDHIRRSFELYTAARKL